ncbi:hypothetical protein GGF32_006780 [Allomyces javanicus]|nr:hypothetical protein GGF32_006780 [Allomyces javanicus]
MDTISSAFLQAPFAARQVQHEKENHAAYREEVVCTYSNTNVRPDGRLPLPPGGSFEFVRLVDFTMENNFYIVDGTMNQFDLTLWPAGTADPAVTPGQRRTYVIPVGCYTMETLGTVLSQTISLFNPLLDVDITYKLSLNAIRNVSQSQITKGNESYWFAHYHGAYSEPVLAAFPVNASTGYNITYRNLGSAMSWFGGANSLDSFGIEVVDGSTMSRIDISQCQWFMTLSFA